MSLPHAFTTDLRWKLISLALAGAIWGAVHNITGTKQGAVDNPLGRRETRSFDGLPVLVVSRAADVREFKVQPETVAVTLRGSPEAMAQVTEKEIEVHVDLTDIESARSLRKRVSVSTPPGVTFLNVDPAEVDVVIPPKRKK